MVVVVADSPELVAPLARAVSSVLAAADPSKVTVQTSENFAVLHDLVQDQLGASGRGLTLAILALCALLAAAILYGTTTMRRKDFGRRRALGASQHLIIRLLLTQVLLLALIGAALGTVAGLVALTFTGDPLPGPHYVLGLAALAVCVGLVASLAPALSAARREPITELRVP